MSNFRDTLFYANEMNLNAHLSDKLHYHYLFYSVRKTKRFQKKKTDDDKRLEASMKREHELVSLIQEHYKYNVTKARQALAVLTEEQINTIRKRQQKGEWKKMTNLLETLVEVKIAEEEDF